MSEPKGQVHADVVRVGGDARQRLYDARGYGRPLEGNALALSRVEAAYLLYRGDLAAVDGMDFPSFFKQCTGDGFGIRFLVYADLRRRGFYLSPARWVEAPTPPPTADFVVYERGTGPATDDRLYAVRVIGERSPVPVSSLADEAIAIVDEESEITYLRVEAPALDGSSLVSLPEAVPGDLLDDRIVLWSPPTELYRNGFFGHPLGGRETDADDPLQLSLVEGAYLVDRGAIVVDGGLSAILERGRAVEGDRFDRRLTVYTALRERGLVPKTGFKFGADFRTYSEVTSVDELRHSEHLVRVLAPDHTLAARDLSLDVRLAHGVRKRMVFAIASPNKGTEIVWRSVRRLTP